MTRVWHPARVARFIRDWNDGLDPDALREKYGMRSLAYHVARLRRLGHVLRTRRPGPPRNPLTAPPARP